MARKRRRRSKKRRRCPCPKGWEGHGKRYCFNRRTGDYKARRRKCGKRRRCKRITYMRCR